MNKVIKTKFGNAMLNKKKGYYFITSEKEGNSKKYLHRLIFEDFYQVNLNEEFPDHVIHHVDGDKTNNEIWNLELMSFSEHSTLHHKNKNTSLETKKRMSASQNSLGIFRVTKNKNKTYKRGFIYRYRYYENGKRKVINSTNLDDLKEKVLARGLEWIVLDDSLTYQTTLTGDVV